MNEDLKTAVDRQRREFLLKLGAGLGWLSAAELIGVPVWAQSPQARPAGAFSHGSLTAPHFPPKAKRVIYMHMLGAVSQSDTFDYKPTLEKMRGARSRDALAAVLLGADERDAA